MKFHVSDIIISHINRTSEERKNGKTFHHFLKKDAVGSLVLSPKKSQNIIFIQ